MPVILRPGAITKEMLEEIFPVVEIDKIGCWRKCSAQSTWTKYKHYAPKAEMILVEGEQNKMAQAIQKIVNNWQNDKKIGLLVSDEVANCIKSENICIFQLR